MLAAERAIKLPTDNPVINTIHGKEGPRSRKVMEENGPALNFRATLARGELLKAPFVLGTVERKMNMIGDN